MHVLVFYPLLNWKMHGETLKCISYALKETGNYRLLQYMLAVPKFGQKFPIKINSNLDEISIYYLFYGGVSSSHYRASSGRLNQQLTGKHGD